ncbi:MAG TPA: deoxyribodipyrimidine photo-lyase [Bacteroidota bacterium]|nr:deoxyribodipyrimidine photo-lyase [Bacteroidota bacterium]
MIDGPAPVLVWMRGSLRTTDNTLLSLAARSGGDVIPFLCTSDGWSGSVDSPRRRMLRSSIASLADTLRDGGSALFMLGEDPLEEIPRAALSLRAGTMFVARSADPTFRQTDRLIARGLEEIGCAVHEVDDGVIFGKDALRTSSGTPYTVFTPYKNAWRSRMQEAMPPAPRLVPPLSRMPGLRTCQSLEGYRDAGRGGEPLARKLLAEFVRGRIDTYHATRNSPADDGTSRLSPHIASGAISVRTVLSVVAEARDGGAPGRGRGAEAFVDELIWRDFFHQIMENFPRVAGEPFREQFAAFPWKKGGKSFASWSIGETGYPIVDAGMRQLASEGWMHNRVRMIVASFLTKDLHIDWGRGEDFFFDRLSDADRASNNGNWQWVAGTGTDAAPYFRIFNPVLQGKKFDPAGTYIRRFLPELARVPDSYIHAPWEMSPAMQKSCSFRSGTDYPRPIVDHAREREAALRMYRSAKSTAAPERSLTPAAGDEER